jgi:predicted DNA-binding transcriptional regulator AlpA
MDTHPAASTVADFLTQHDLSQKLQISERTLEDWRLHDDGPPYLKLGRHVRYDPADVDAWAKAQRHG